MCAVIAFTLMQQQGIGQGQFKPIFQVKGNTFRPIFFGNFIADILFNFPLGVFTQRNLVADFVRLKLNFIPKNWKNRFLSQPFGEGT